MSLYQKTLEDFQKMYYAYASLAIIGQSCLGGAAAMYILQNGTTLPQMIQLALVVIMSSFANGAILAQQKHKLVFNLILTSVITSTVMIILNTVLIS